MSKKSIHNQFLNYSKKTSSMERIIKKCTCGNEVEPYLLIVNPKTNKVEEVMQLKTNKGKTKSKTKSKSKTKRSQLGGKKHKKTNKKKTIRKKKKTRKN
jgi:hypothetical protein